MPARSPRPSAREMHNKVREALAALRSDRCSEVIEKHQAMTWDFLGVTRDMDLWKQIEVLLGELLAAGPEKCYAGRHPPQKSYEPAIKNEELWAYAWQSHRTGKLTYLKFAIKKSKRKTKSNKEDAEPWLFLVDCHESKPK